MSKKLPEYEDNIPDSVYKTMMDSTGEEFIVSVDPNGPIPEIEEWVVKLLERTVFQEKLSERPWIHHTMMEPKIMSHMIDPMKRPMDGENYLCVCDKPIPALIMQKYFFLKSVCEGKRAGQK